MALTKELIQKNVEGLTEEQVTALTKLSENAFSEAIATRIGELHGQYDQDIKSVLGKDKPAGVKTYEWLKQELSTLKSKAEATQGLTAEIEALKSQIKDGKGNDAMKQQLADLENHRNELQKALEAEKTAAAERIQAEQAKAAELRISYEFEKALQGVKFKPDDIMPAAVRETFIQAAKTKILGEVKPDWIDDGNGGQRLVFRNANGQVMNNPDNALNPFTAADLLKKELTPILDVGKKQEGAGTKPGQNGQNGGAFTLADVSTQVQATERITDYLMAKGLRNGSTEFQEAMSKIWSEEKVSSLPFS